MDLPDDLNPSDHSVLAENVLQEGLLGYALKIFRNPVSSFDNMGKPQLFLREKFARCFSIYQSRFGII
jgi:hypothetical protein